MSVNLSADLSIGMGDDYFSVYMLIACEKDVVYSISCNAVINKFAQLSPVQRKHKVHFDRAN